MIHVPEERSVERTNEALKAILSARTQESAMTIVERWTQEGREQALQHDRQRFLKLLQLRYGEVPEAFASRVQAATQDEVDALMLRFASTETLEGVFAED